MKPSFWQKLSSIVAKNELLAASCFGFEDFDARDKFFDGSFQNAPPKLIDLFENLMEVL